MLVSKSINAVIEREVTRTRESIADLEEIVQSGMSGSIIAIWAEGPAYLERRLADRRADLVEFENLLRRLRLSK